MSSVSPSSSASNASVPGEVHGFAAIASCLTEIRLLAEKGMLTPREVASFTSQLFPAYHATLRRSPSVSTLSAASERSRSSSTSSGGKKKGRVVRSASGRVRPELQRNWRRPSEPERGFCYERMLKAGAQSGLVQQWGPGPTLYRLMGSDVKNFKSLPELARLSLEGGVDRAHVVPAKEGGNLVAHLRSVAQVCVPGLQTHTTLWHALRELGPTDGLVSQFCGETQVGYSPISAKGDKTKLGEALVRFRSTPELVAAANAYRLGLAGSYPEGRGPKQTTVFTSFAGPVLAQDDNFLLIGNRSSYFAEQHQPQGQAGMAMCHLMVIPRARLFNAVSLAKGDEAVIPGMKRFFLSAWNDSGVRERAYQHQVVAVRRAGGQWANFAERYLEDKRSEVFGPQALNDLEMGFHLFPDNSVEHLHMHVLMGTREYSTREHDWKTHSADSVQAALFG